MSFQRFSKRAARWRRARRSRNSAPSTTGGRKTSSAGAATKNSRPAVAITGRIVRIGPGRFVKKDEPGGDVDRQRS